MRPLPYAISVTIRDRTSLSYSCHGIRQDGLRERFLPMSEGLSDSQRARPMYTEWNVESCYKKVVEPKTGHRDVSHCCPGRH